MYDESVAEASDEIGRTGHVFHIRGGFDVDRLHSEEFAVGEHEDVYPPHSGTEEDIRFVECDVHHRLGKGEQVPDPVLPGRVYQDLGFVKGLRAFAGIGVEAIIVLAPGIAEIHHLLHMSAPAAQKSDFHLSNMRIVINVFFSILF